MNYTPEQLTAIYRAARAVAERRIEMAAAARELRSITGMPYSTAMIVANSARHLLRGEEYRRTLNGPMTHGLLHGAFHHDGPQALQVALDGLAAHIAYYELTVNPNALTQRQIHREFSALLDAHDPSAVPQELEEDEASYPEGSVGRVLVNRYERNREARNACIEAHGCACVVCGFDFEAAYGDLGRGFIHVHHVVELSTIGRQYHVDPVADMRPVCPNCHAMLHRQRPALTPEALKAMLTR